MAPLEHLVSYLPNAYPNRYWTAAHNVTEWNLVMTQYTVAGNMLSKLMLQALAPSLPGAHIGASPSPLPLLPSLSPTTPNRQTDQDIAQASSTRTGSSST